MTELFADGLPSGPQLKAERERWGLSQTTLAPFMGVVHQRVSMIESLARVSWEMKERYMAALLAARRARGETKV